MIKFKNHLLLKIFLAVLDLLKISLPAFLVYILFEEPLSRLGEILTEKM